MTDVGSSGRTQYYTAATLDGFIADPDDSLGWLMRLPEGGNEDYPEFIANIGALAMGSVTYEWLLRHHVHEPGKPPKPWPYEQPSWVFSTRELPRIDGADIRFVRGDVVPVHAEMLRAAAGKNVWLVGGGDLVGQFHDHGLLDELIVTIASVTLGAGKPLLPRVIADPPLRLHTVRQIGEAFVQLRYEVPRNSGAPSLRQP